MRHWLDSIGQDVRFALRGWRQAPPFAIAAIATLALGIGANTAIFSVVSAALFRPLPFSHPEQLVQVDERQPPSAAGVGFDGTVVTGDFDQWRRNSRFVERFATYAKSAKNFQAVGGATRPEPERITTVAADGEFFALLGVRALIGRTFDGRDAPNAVVTSFDFWRSHFGGERNVAGRSILLDGEP